MIFTVFRRGFQRFCSVFSTVFQRFFSLPSPAFCGRMALSKEKDVRQFGPASFFVWLMFMEE